MENIEIIEKNKKRLPNSTTELKKRLAAQIKQHPRIWDVTDKLHSKKDAVEQSWMEISEVVQLPANECKSAWSSMQESYRYHAKVSRQAKSGDPLLENENLDWEFAEDLAFLPKTSQKRKTCQSHQSDLDDSIGISDASSQYGYCATSTSSDAKFKGPLATFEWLLNKLPEDVAERACEEINAYLLKTIDDERQKNN